MGKASKDIPTLAYGNRIYPENIAGMIGLPHVGEVFYVDPANGSDTANGGRSQDDALATVYAAEALTTDGQHDVVIIAPESGSGRTSETASIVWDKNFTHLIGSAGPISLDVRAGMSMGSAAASPAFTLSGSGCVFKDITIAEFNDIDVMFSLTGSRNYFEGVHFAGIGNATAGDGTAARSVEAEGSSENRWVDCTFGLDTATRSTTNASLSFGGVCARNQLIGCQFNMFTDNAGPNHILIENNDAAQRYLLIKDCIFHNPDTASSTEITEVIGGMGAGINGTVMLIDSWYTGAGDWADDFTHLWFNMGKPDTDEGGDLIIGT